MRAVPTPVLVVLVMAALAGCAASPAVPLSSLGHEVDVHPLRGQAVDLLKQDDAACESWTRSTKGPNEPLPAAELRYSACALSRGYSVKPWDHRSSPPASAPDLAGVVADLQGCGLKRGLYDPAGLVVLGAVEAGMTEARRAEAWACLKQRGYAVDYQPDARAESIRKK
jgi:hypothetical protein